MKIVTGDLGRGARRLSTGIGEIAAVFSRAVGQNPGDGRTRRKNIDLLVSSAITKTTLIEVPQD